MDTLDDLIIALRSDLNITSSSSLYPTATLELAINRAYIKASRLFRWPQLEDAKRTTSQLNIEYYDMPETWSPNSMWRLEVNAVQYGEDPDGSPMSYEDYTQWRADTDNAASTDEKWAQQWLRFFFWPLPTAGLTIDAWGQKNVTALSSGTDDTIFSHNMPECNEALVLEASAILKKKGEDDKKGVMFSDESKQILAVSFGKLKQEKAKFEKTQPFFHVDDMFGHSATSDIIGNFS